jgi:hypothetical protein
MSVYYGTIKGNMVVLPEGVNLTDGMIVEVRVIPPEIQSSQHVASEDLFKERLIELGLLRKVRKVTSPLIIDEERTPIRFKGKSLSQIIIEERR